jgi:hypothetical protein
MLIAFGVVLLLLAMGTVGLRSLLAKHQALESSTAASYASFLPWEKTFSIVHWHQRGAGLTYAATPHNAPPLTIDRMAQDG